MYWWLKACMPTPVGLLFRACPVTLPRSLQADVVLVASGADTEGIVQTQHMIAQVSRAGRTVVGVVFQPRSARF